ncbi:MAG: sugar isomerase domain-containing protein [Erysipelotrichia bacterium]|nr:sugar isomerase domain-containing protein [Erysipelotrichia bacterium]
MNVIKEYFDTLIANIDRVYDSQKHNVVKAANMMAECMEQGGVIQLFGTEQGIEFCNELNYRAGGIAYFHNYSLNHLLMHNIITKEDVYVTKKAYQDASLIDKMEEMYQLDNRDMYCLISQSGNEPLIIELAKKAKERGQKIIAVVNKQSYDKNNGKLLDYADMYLDIDSADPDLALNINGVKCCQTGTTVANILAQMIHAEIYRYYVNKFGKAPVLLSANINQADIHNNALTDPYERRIR